MTAKKLVIQILRRILRPVVVEIINSDIRIWGDSSRLRIAKTAHMVNTLFNLASGEIEVGDYTFTGHNVSIITGAHDYNAFMKERVLAVPKSSRDIKIGKGVWIGSNAIILGPCTIGDHSVIAAGSIVNGDVAPYSIVAGSPAREVKRIRTIENMGAGGSSQLVRE